MIFLFEIKDPEKISKRKKCYLLETFCAGDEMGWMVPWESEVYMKDNKHDFLWSITHTALTSRKHTTKTNM